MGGGEHLEAGYRFVCERANQGDFLILRANTEDDYAQQVNKDISAICPVNSMATIVFSDREDSDDPKVVEIIQQMPWPAAKISIALVLTGHVEF